jgi:hypothetical protein
MFKGIDSDSDSDCSDSSDDERGASGERASPFPLAPEEPRRGRGRPRVDTLTASLPSRPLNYKVRGGKARGLTKSHVLEHRKRFPYTADKLGQIGNVKVDVKELRGGNLVVSDLNGDEILEISDLGKPLSSNVYPCIYHLVMSTGTGCLENGKYDAEECEKSVEAFRQLIEKSCLKPHNCAKYNVIYGESSVARTYEFIVYQDPDELLDMLEIIEGSLLAGNVENSMLRKKSIAIIEQLYKTNAIEHDDYVQLYDKFVKYK